MPTGTRSSSSLRTYSLVLRTALPIGAVIRFSSRVSGVMTAWVMSSEHSVGPYAFIIGMPGKRANQRRHSSVGSSSPVTTSHRRAGSSGASAPSSQMSSAARSRDGTTSRTVTSSWATMRNRPSGSAARSWPTASTRPPVSSGAIICQTETSKVRGAFWTSVSAAVRVRSSTLASRWLFMPRWCTIAPLGRPVEPEVKMT